MPSFPGVALKPRQTKTQQTGGASISHTAASTALQRSGVLYALKSEPRPQTLPWEVPQPPKKELPNKRSCRSTMEKLMKRCWPAVCIYRLQEAEVWESWQSNRTMTGHLTGHLRGATKPTTDRHGSPRLVTLSQGIGLCPSSVTHFT